MHHALQYLSSSVTKIFTSGIRYGLLSGHGHLTPDYNTTRTTFRQRGYRFSGPVAWNGLPTEIHYMAYIKLFNERAVAQDCIV